MGDPRRSRGRARRAIFVLAALAAAVVLVAAALAGCGGDSTSSGDPLVGYWVGGGASQMTLVQVQKDGDTYTVLSNPDAPTGDAVKNGDSLVINTHVVKMTLTPQAGGDELQLTFTGEMFKTPAGVMLKRTDEAGYADAATAFGILAIRRGLAMWKAGGGKTYPPAAEVAPDGMLAKMIRWPTNMFTGRPMQPAKDKGDYTYAQLAGGKQYSLVGYLSDGGTVGK